MHEIIEIMNMRRTLVATAPDFAEAKAKVEAMGVAFMENDTDYPECADAFMNDGRILAIQPEGFKLENAA